MGISLHFIKDSSTHALTATWKCLDILPHRSNCGLFLPPWHKEVTSMFLVALVCLYVCLFVDITQNVMTGLEGSCVVQ